MSEASGQQRVLLARPSALGDVARTVPALVTLREAMPEAHIDWLVHEAFVDVVQHHPALDGVVPFPRKRFAQVWRSPAAMGAFLGWTRALRRRRYDFVVDLQGLFRSGLFTWMTRAPRRLGFANAREGARFAYTEKYAVDPQMHTVDRMLGLLEHAGFTPKHDLRLHVGPDDQQWLQHHLASHGGVDRPYVCLAPTAQWPAKCWPVDRFAELGRRLLTREESGGRLFVIAAPHEGDVAERLLEALPDDGAIVDAPRTTVGQMMALVSRTDLLVCNDSGPLHLAVGFDRPIVALFGPTLPEQVGPYRRDETVVRAPDVDAETARYYRHHRDDPSLMQRIDVESVWQRALAQFTRTTADGDAC